MSEKLHILFLSSSYPSKISPTNGNFVQRHAEAVATRHRVTVVFPIGDFDCEETYTIDFKIINQVNTIIIYFKKHPNKLINAYRKFKALKLGLKETDDFDIIHGNIIYPIGVFVWIISKLRKKPYILTEHWSGYLPDAKNSHSSLEIIIIKYLAKSANFITPVSLQLQKAMRQLKIKGNYRIIGNVIDTTIFYPKKSIYKVFTIVHVSTFNDDSKNISGILRVINKLSQIRTDFIFKIIGDGDIFNLQKKINKLNIPKTVIQVEGTKKTKEISEILQNSNLYISFSNFETFGIVMTESLACGVPVISTKTGILNDINNPNFGSLISIGDEQALLENIIKYLNSDRKLNSRKELMHNYIKNNFSIEVISFQFSDLYFKTLNI